MSIGEKAMNRLIILYSVPLLALLSVLCLIVGVPLIDFKSIWCDPYMEEGAGWFIVSVSTILWGLILTLTYLAV